MYGEYNIKKTDIEIIIRELINVLNLSNMKREIENFRLATGKLVASMLIMSLALLSCSNDVNDAKLGG